MVMVFYQIYKSDPFDRFHVYRDKLLVKELISNALKKR
ncbi:hypothetical protein PLUTE_b0124 [Pseudoalteromonas luteoviolacea DSM 6061]|nr:hypothetical protein [Pseudoalteromonas luteoviolacea DSM 6061]